ncbi:MAG: GntR family transcriptional regulator [Deltaproteobacteria bacterium]|nr:MAG: GntR family transcriptional regulator [Deltaproteobacteria bacterium]
MVENGVLDVRSLREQVYEYLRGEIQMGRIVPGSFIQLNAISERLGISKTPLRDAIIQLECEGFVTILPRRGVVVNKLTLEEIIDVLEIVGALESAVIVSVFDQIKTSHLKKMTQLNRQMRKQLKSDRFNRFDQEFYRLNIAFHDVFLNLSKNRSLGQIIMPIKQRLYDFPRPSYIREWELINCDEHDRLIDLIKAGKKEKAASLWRDEHWSFSAHEEFIREFYSLGNQHIQAQHNQDRQT